MKWERVKEGVIVLLLAVIGFFAKRAFDELDSIDNQVRTINDRLTRVETVLTVTPH